MPRNDTIRLREAPGRPAPDAEVIDVKYVEVGAKRRRLLGRLWMALVTVFWAAVIGFLIPPAWVLVETVGSYFAPSG
jgi:hypothetical protein